LKLGLGATQGHRKW